MDHITTIASVLAALENARAHDTAIAAMAFLVRCAEDKDAAMASDEMMVLAASAARMTLCSWPECDSTASTIVAGHKLCAEHGQRYARDHSLPTITPLRRIV